MSFQTLSRNIGGVADVKSVLSDSSTRRIGRALTIGSSWTTLRIGLRWACIDTGANISSTPSFAFGVTTNPTNGFTNVPNGGSAHSCYLASSGGSTWTRSTGPVKYTVNVLPVWNNAGSFHLGTGSNLFISANPDVRLAWVLEFQKNVPSAGNLQISFAEPSQVSDVVDVPYSTMESAMNAATMANVRTTLGYSGAIITQPSNQLSASLSDLTAVFTSWNGAPPTPVEVSEVLLRVLA